jgi:uncharacterized membrane protein
MEVFIDYALIGHIIAGFIALFVAPVAMITPKGRKLHRVSGKAYFWAMTAVTLTAVIISAYRPIPFLLMVAVFSYYSVATGYRWLYLKKLHRGQEPALLDWLIPGVAMAFSLGLIGYGVLLLVENPGNAFAYVSVALGSVGTLGSGNHMRKLVKPPDQKNAWFFEHMGGMLGGYIATTTAFSAVNFHFLPTVVRWLWPAAIGVPAIILWSDYYKRRFSKGKEPQEVGL